MKLSVNTLLATLSSYHSLTSLLFIYNTLQKATWENYQILNMPFGYTDTQIKIVTIFQIIHAMFY